MSDLIEEKAVIEEIKNDLDMHEYRTLTNGTLTPRHRRFCQLAAAGATNGTIAKELGFTPGRVSQLLQNQHIVTEIHRLQDKIFEKGAQEQFKDLVEISMKNIKEIIDDTTGRVKPHVKLAASQWVLEMTVGKATQRTDIGENMLAVFLDQLDAKKTQSLPAAPRDVGPMGDVIDIESKKAPEPVDALTEWVNDFVQQE